MSFLIVKTKISLRLLLIVNFIKKRWKNLRDTYLKKRKEENGRSGDAARKTKDWKYKNIIAFLEPYIDTPR